MVRPGDSLGNLSARSARGGAPAEDRGLVRPRTASRGLFAAAPVSARLSAEGPSRLATMAPSPRTAAPVSRPVSRPQTATATGTTTPRPLDTSARPLDTACSGTHPPGSPARATQATPQQRRRAYAVAPAVAPPAVAAGATALSSRCALPGTAQPVAKWRADSPAKLCSPGTGATSHYSLCSGPAEAATGSREEQDDVSASAMYYADWSDPALFASPRDGSLSQQALMSMGSSASHSGSAAASSTALCEPLAVVTPRAEVPPLATPRDLEGDSDGEAFTIEREKCLLLAAISGLSATADAAVRRAEAAEAAMRRKQTAETAEDASVLAAQQALEARIRDSVMLEVRDAVRAAAEEATVELRAAAQEIRRLRADAAAREARTPSCAEASREAMAQMRSVMEELRRLRGAGDPVSEASCEACQVTERASGEEHWAGCNLSTAPTSEGSSPTQPPESQALASEGLSSDETTFTAVRPGLFRVEEPVTYAGDDMGQVVVREDDANGFSRTFSEADRLRVRDVVSKLERQRELSAVRDQRLGHSASTAAIKYTAAWPETPAPRHAESRPRPTAIFTGVTLMPTPASPMPSSSPSNVGPMLGRLSGGPPGGTTLGPRSASAAPPGRTEARSYTELM